MKRRLLSIFVLCCLVACEKQAVRSTETENNKTSKSTSKQVLAKNAEITNTVIFKSAYVDYRPLHKSLDNADSETRKDTLIVSVDNPKVSHCNNEFSVLVYKEQLKKNEQLIMPVLIASMIKVPIQVAVDAKYCRLLAVINAHELTPDKLDAAL